MRLAGQIACRSLVQNVNCPQKSTSGLHVVARFRMVLSEEDKIWELSFKIQFQRFGNTGSTALCLLGQKNLLFQHFRSGSWGSWEPHSTSSSTSLSLESSASSSAWTFMHVESAYMSGLGFRAYVGFSWTKCSDLTFSKGLGSDTLRLSPGRPRRGEQRSFSP